MLASCSTCQSLASSSRRQRSNRSFSTFTTSSRSRYITAAIPRDDSSVVTSAAAQTATTAAAVAAGLLLGCCLQPSAALALPQQQLENIRQAIEKDFSEGGHAENQLAGPITRYDSFGNSMRLLLII
jgi:hypothetical protein